MRNLSTSIIVVAHNSAVYVEKLLKSIVKHTNKEDGIDVIVLDNNSDDRIKLKQLIDSYKTTLNIDVILRRQNYGFAHSCNYGATLTKKKHLLFLNPDTEITKDSIYNIVTHLVIEKANVAGGLVQSTNRELSHRTVYNKPTVADILYEFSNLGKVLNHKSNFYVDQSKIIKDTHVFGVSGAYLLIENKIFKNLRGFDTKFFMYLEDVDLCVRAQSHNYKVIYCPHSIILHKGGGSSNNKYKILHKAWYDSREYYLQKHFGLSLILPILLLYKIERFMLKIRRYFI